MQQLTLQDLKELIQDLEKMNIDLSKMQVYLGDDEELNGVHNAWNITLLDKKTEYAVFPVPLSPSTKYLLLCSISSNLESRTNN